jgi:hypothetical protein
MDIREKRRRLTAAWLNIVAAGVISGGAVGPVIAIVVANGSPEQTSRAQSCGGPGTRRRRATRKPEDTLDAVATDLPHGKIRVRTHDLPAAGRLLCAVLRLARTSAGKLARWAAASSALTEPISCNAAARGCPWG